MFLDSVSKPALSKAEWVWNDNNSTDFSAALEMTTTCQVCEGTFSGLGSLTKGLSDCGSATLR
jgi:hypothetical protein